MTDLPTHAKPAYDRDRVEAIAQQIAQGEPFDGFAEELDAIYSAQEGSYQSRDWRFCNYDLTHIDGLSYPVRGPAPQMLHPGGYFVVLGSATSFGARVTSPYGQLVSDWLGMPYLNLSHAGASPEFYVKHHMAEIQPWLAQAAFVIIEVMSSRSISNDRFESVEGRGVARDKKKPSAEPVRVLPVLRRMAKAGRMAKLEKLVRQSLHGHRTHFEQLVQAAPGKKVLLWLSKGSPDDFDRREVAKMTSKTFLAHAGRHPHFNDRKLVRNLSRLVDAYVECVTTVGQPFLGVNRFTGNEEPWTRRMGKEDASGQAYYPSPEMHQAAFEMIKAKLPELGFAPDRPSD